MPEHSLTAYDELEAMTFKLEDRIKVLEERVDELEGDLRRFAKLAGQHGGEPYRSLLKEIVSKKQGR